MVKSKNRNPGQGIIGFEEPLGIPPVYDSKRARQAATRRRNRVGNNPRIKGFVSRTSGLFVPHSGTENSAIIEIPENKAKLETNSARNRVIEKYEGNEDVSLNQVDLWSHFASQRAQATIRRKYRGFRDEALTNAARIGSVLEPLGGIITRELFTYDPEYRINPDAHRARNDVLSYNSVLKYFIDLEAFTGDNPALLNKANRRKWPQTRHTHDYRERMERAHNELEPLADDLFAERVDEAYWSHMSRGRFWVGVINEHEKYKKEHREKENIRLGMQPPPPEYLASLVKSDPYDQ